MLDYSSQSAFTWKMTTLPFHRNRNHLLNNMTTTELNLGDLLPSFDVELLFTNVPTHERFWQSVSFRTGAQIETNRYCLPSMVPSKQQRRILLITHVCECCIQIPFIFGVYILPTHVSHRHQATFVDDTTSWDRTRCSKGAWVLSTQLNIIQTWMITSEVKSVLAPLLTQLSRNSSENELKYHAYDLHGRSFCWRQQLGLKLLTLYRLIARISTHKIFAYNVMLKPIWNGMNYNRVGKSNIEIQRNFLRITIQTISLYVPDHITGDLQITSVKLQWIENYFNRLWVHSNTLLDCS